MALYLTTCILVALAAWSPLATSTLILPLLKDHKYEVMIKAAELTDRTRLDPFARDGRLRSIMVSSFAPIATCSELVVEPYMPPITAAFEDANLAAYGLPKGTVPSLGLQTCNETHRKSSCSSSSSTAAFFPLVVFSGALGTSRFLYHNLLQNLAAKGYFIISIDHPYDADIVEFPNGTVIKGVDIEDDASIELALQTRAADMRFVREQMINTSVTNVLFPAQGKVSLATNVAFIGHSLGGAAAAEAMLYDHAVKAGLNLDGTFFGDVVNRGVDRPFLLLGHDNKTQATDPSWKAIGPHLRSWKSELEVRGAQHYSFSDLPLIAAALRIQGRLAEAVQQIIGKVEGHLMMSITTVFVAAFLDMVFKAGSDEILIHGDRRYPEVIRAD